MAVSELVPIEEGDTPELEEIDITAINREALEVFDVDLLSPGNQIMGSVRLSADGPEINLESLWMSWEGLEDGIVAEQLESLSAHIFEQGFEKLTTTTEDPLIQKAFISAGFRLVRLETELGAFEYEKLAKQNTPVETVKVNASQWLPDTES